ncbi:Fatty acid synthase [Eumeta japonica]|uniref:Fatty acid synthase n=1 Tax=Eumeta variegata TaxID=151549 RepID=A0A4C1XRQ6_EUMVA|nr:Fatty acid synthase [Eumeta japonica]
MTLNVQKQYAWRIQQLPIQTMIPRRQAPRFQRRKKKSLMNHISVLDLLIPTAHLTRYLETVHPAPKDKNKKFFVRKKEQSLESQENMMHVTQTINEKATKASYLVSYRILQAGYHLQGIWGCEYYLPSNDDQAINPTTRMNSTAPGDNESLSCMEAHENASSKSVQVQYAGLTHYDNLKAATATSNASDNGLYCMDYSGLNSRGERVMGVVASGALAPSVVPDEDLLWSVPEHWTLEDAATVPQPYIHAFYCLIEVSRWIEDTGSLRHGRAWSLIISIALDMGCEVFTTVSSAGQTILKSLFPDLEELFVEGYKGTKRDPICKEIRSNSWFYYKLNSYPGRQSSDSMFEELLIFWGYPLINPIFDNHIGSCRDVSFEHVVMEQTNGEGCAFVVSCLDGELREASMRCVAIAGVFINVAMSDCYENASFKYNFLLKFRIHTQINFSLIFEIEDNLTKRTPSDTFRLHLQVLGTMYYQSAIRDKSNELKHNGSFLFSSEDSKTTYQLHL